MADKLKLPPFTSNVEGWLKHIEAIMAGVSLTKQQKHHALVSALPTEVVLQVKDPAVNPSTEHPFKELKDALLQRYRKPDYVYLSQLQNLTLGDGTPSSLWEQMATINSRCLAPLPEPLLCQFFLPKLPTEI